MGNKIRWKAAAVLLTVLLLISVIVVLNYATQIKELKQKIAGYEDIGNGIRRHGQLQVREGTLIDESGNPIQLQGISSHGLTWYPRHTNAGALNFWKEAGANVFRASMYSDQERGYIYYPEESSNYLYIAVENALACDMYAIIDWHILYDSNPLDHMDEAKVFFEDAASHYRNEPGIIYEICNEPNDDTTWDDITAYAKEIIPVIRKYAPASVIVVGMPNYCTDYEPVLNTPLEFDNIMYAFHQYVDGKGAPYDSYILEKMVENQMPVFVTEWGIGLGAQEGKEVNFTASDRFLDFLDKYNISWTVWSLSNMDNSHALIKAESREYGALSVEDLSEVGEYVYERLKASSPPIKTIY